MSTTTIRLAIQAVSELPLVHQQLSKLIELTEQAKTVTQQAAQQHQAATQEQKAAIQQQVAEYRAALQQQTNALKAELDQQTAITRAEASQQTAAKKAEISQQTSIIRGEISQQTAALKAEASQQTAIVKGEQDRQTAALKAELNQQTALYRSELAQQNAAVRSHVSSAGSAFADLGSYVKAALTIEAIKQFTEQVVEAKSKIDLFKTALIQMTGTREEANKLFEQIQAMALKSPFEVEKLLETTQQLKAMGVATKDLLPTMDMLGNIASAVGMEKLPRLAKAFTDVQNRQKLYAGETRQFSEAGVNLYELLAKSMDKPLEQVIKLAQAHEISFAQVKKALQDATSSGGLYYNQMGIASQTLAGQTSNLADRFFFAKARLGDYYEEGLKNAITWTSKFIDALLGNGQAIQRTEAWLEAATAAYVTYRVAVSATATAKIRAAEAEAASTAATAANAAATTASSAATSRFSGVLTTLWTTITRNPLGALVTAVMAIVTATQLWQAATASMKETMGEQEQGLLREQTLLGATANVALNAAQGSDLRRQAIATIVQQYPEYFKGLNTETISNAQLRQVLSQVNLSYAQRIELAQKAYLVEQAVETQNKLFAKQLDLLNQVRERAPEYAYLVDRAGGSVKTLYEEIEKLAPAVQRHFQQQIEGGNVASKTWNALTNAVNGNWRGLMGAMNEIPGAIDANARQLDKYRTDQIDLEGKYHLDSKNLTLAHNAAMLGIASDNAEKYKTITVQSAAQIALEKAAQNQQTYKEKLAYLDKEEKAEIESVNKIRVAKDASDTEIAKATEVAQGKINGIIKTYQDKRVELSRNEWLKISEVIEQANKGLEEGEIQRLTIQTEGYKGAKERAKEYTELTKQTAQIEKEAARDVAQTQNERFKIEEQSRRKLFALVLDFASQESGLVGQMGRAAKAVFDNWDAISGKSKESAEQRVRETETLFNAAQARLTFLMDFGTGEQIQKQKQVVAGAKVTAEEAKTELEKVTASSQQAMAGLLSLGFQAFVALGKAVDEQIQAQRQAQADAFREFRDIHRGFYDWLIDASKEAYKQELESFSRGYDEKRTIIERFYEYQGELMKNRDGVDAQLAQVQEILDAKGDARALMRNSEQDQMAFEKAHLETRLKQIELEKQRLTDLHDAKLSQISEEFEARRDQINAEIDAAKDAFEIKKDLIEQERDKKKEAIEDQLSALKDSYDQQKALAQQQYDDAVQKVNDRYDAEKKALQDTYDFRRSLVEQSKADELEAAGIIDRLRDDVLERYRTTEVDKLTAQRDRILAGNLSEKERADVMNAFAERIGQVHKDVEDAKLDKSKANTIISKQLKQEEKDLTEKLKEEETNKIIELETRQKNEITDLKTQLKTTLDTYRQDFETKERELKGRIRDLEVDTKNKIEALQTELRNTITGYQNQLRDNELDAAHKKELANRAYIGAVRQAQAEAFEANKQISIIELRIAVLKLRAAGAAQGLIDQVNAMISELGGVSGPAAYGTPVVINPSGGIGGAYAAAQDVASKRGSDDVYRGWFTSDGAPVEVFYNPNDNKVITVYDAAKNPIQLRNADGYIPSTGKRFAQGTEYVDGPYPSGVDTIPALLNRGERVIPTEQNALLGNISNTELIARMLQPRLAIPVLPARLNLPDTVGMSGGSSAMLAELRELRKAIQDKELLQLNVDNGGIAAAMIAQDQKTTYHANRFQF
ncbi:phage tape measure protein [Fibrella aestuarina BUZ 2]|uniref:Phage tape measure protein n=1 Tax=Fibrella aestuarina BUZ 2 TaxID=1166018 RepID=I0K6T8_9BACT|nr:tape measure protein [Fibrella aestuarina]CCG99841.1 phage tape measure protein [Fibrella aestuarina BUZ 2]